MATDLDTRPDADSDAQNVGQQHYDDMFKNLTSAEHQAKDGTPGQLSGEGSSLFNASKDAGGAAAGASIGGGVAGAAAAGGFAGRLKGIGSGIKNFTWGTKNRKRATIGSSTVGGLIVAGTIGSVWLAGPFELIHISQLLQNFHMQSQEDAGDDRLGRLYRLVKTSDVGETRIGWLASRYKSSMLDDMAKIGIVPETSKATTFKGLTVRTDTTDGPFSGKSLDELNQQLDRNGISQRFEKVGNNEYRVKAGGVVSQRRMTKFMTASLGKSKVSTALRTRIFRKYYLISFHPFKMLDKKIDEKIGEAYDKWKKSHTEELENGADETAVGVDADDAHTESTDDKGNTTTTDASASDKQAADGATKDPAISSKIMEGLPGGKITVGVAGGLAAVQGIVCGLRTVADNVDDIRQTQVIAPLMRMGMDAVTTGEQTKSGQDMDTELAQFEANSYVTKDKNGKVTSEWDEASSVKYELGQDPKTGAEAPTAVQDISKGIPGWLQWTQDGKLASICSKAGQWIGGGLGVVVGVVSGGIVSTVAGLVSGAVLGPKVIDAASHMLAGEAVNVAASGAEWGNDVNYGARLAGNSQALLFGGAKLSDKQAAVLQQQVNQENQQEFQSQSLGYRIFNPDDPQTVASKLIDKSTDLQPSNLANTVASALTNFGALLKLPATLLSSKVSADNNYNYDYGFPQFGFSSDDLDNPLVADPYKNADDVAKIMDNDANNGNKYHDKAEKCFNVDLQKGTDGWDVVPMPDAKDFNPYSSKGYNADDCVDSGNNDWLQIRFFIMDTAVFEGYACSLGDETSCINDGVTDDNSSTTATQATTFNLGSFNICYGHRSDGGAGLPDCAKGVDYSTRLTNTINVIQSRNMEVVGLQEVREEQYNAIKKRLSGSYDIFPKSYNVGYASQNPIIYDTSRFDLVDSGSKTITGYTVTNGGPKSDTDTQVELQDKNTGATFYLINEHEPVKTGNGGAAQSAIWRKESAIARAQYVKQLQTDSTPVFITGDMNSSYEAAAAQGGQRANLPYCILTDNTGLWDALDASKGNSGKCPTTDNGAIDHIYMSTEVSATNYTYSQGGVFNDGSDHNALSATVTIPGGAGGYINYKNPILNRSAPDPDIIKGDDGKYYLYATGGNNTDPFGHWVSDDLTHWKETPNLFGSAGNVPIILNGPDNLRWAPDVAKTGDHYTLTFTGGTDANRTIGYATASSPAGPFKYRGELVKPGGLGTPNAKGTIDSHIFMDGNDAYLSIGGGVIRVVKLNIAGDGTISLGKSVVALQKQNTVTIEGSFLTKHGDWYYLYYSYGDYNAKSGGNEYTEAVVRSKNPMGPFNPGPAAPGGDAHVLLKGKDPFRGPGGGSVFSDDASNDWMVYHAWYKGDRVAMLDKITYDSDGWPEVNNGNGPSTGQQTGPYIAGLATGTAGGTSNLADTYSPACHGNGNTYSVACSGQCVDYVEYMLNKNENAPGKYTSFGTGANVAPELISRYGMKRDSTAQVGDVVSFPQGGVPGASASDSAGHVAVVIAVKSDGSIIVAEYNYFNRDHANVDGSTTGASTGVDGGHYFDTRLVPASAAKNSRLTYAHAGIKL